MRPTFEYRLLVLASVCPEIGFAKKNAGLKQEKLLEERTF